jgi:hypothetical protein
VRRRERKVWQEDSNIRWKEIKTTKSLPQNQKSTFCWKKSKSQEKAIWKLKKKN